MVVIECVEKQKELKHIIPETYHPWYSVFTITYLRASWKLCGTDQFSTTAALSRNQLGYATIQQTMAICIPVYVCECVILYLHGPKSNRNKIHHNASVNGNDKLVRSDFFLELELLQVAFEEEIAAQWLVLPVNIDYCIAYCAILHTWSSWTWLGGPWVLAARAGRA